jgi:hypothetical protein
MWDDWGLHPQINIKADGSELKAFVLFLVRLAMHLSQQVNSNPLSSGKPYQKRSEGFLFEMLRLP